MIVTIRDKIYNCSRITLRIGGDGSDSDTIHKRKEEIISEFTSKIPQAQWMETNVRLDRTFITFHDMTE